MFRIAFVIGALLPLFIAVFVATTPAIAFQQEIPPAEKASIRWLIDHVAKLPDAVFIRNGQEHSTAEAADHMRTKLVAAGDSVKTAQDFIKLCATRSSETGQPYLIRFKDGREVESGPYLTEALRSLEGGGAPAAPPQTQPHPGAAEPLTELPPHQPHVIQDPKAAEAVAAMMTAINNGLERNSARYITWRHLGTRRHIWDRETGDIRVETGGVAKPSDDQRPADVILMNARSMKGRVWISGEEIVDPDRLKAMLSLGLNAWAYDSIDLFLPYFLERPDVVVTHVGAERMKDGRSAQKLKVVFEPQSFMPNAKFEVWVADDDHLIGQWSVYRKADDKKPERTESWSDWKQYNGMKLSTRRGSRKHTDIEIFNELPREVFTDPKPVDFAALCAAGVAMGMLPGEDATEAVFPEDIPASQQIRNGLKPLEPLIGKWQGEMILPAREGRTETRTAIAWTNAWSFDGRWFRMEFASKEPRGERGYMEWMGLFTFNPTEKRVETVWMTPRIRSREGSFLDGRDIFFEKGAFNAAGNVLTLIAPKQQGKDAPVVEVQSTFTFTDADHFICIDAEKDPATGNWNQSMRFELTRVK